MAKKTVKADVYTGNSANVVERLTEKLGNNAAMFGLFAFGETHFRQKYSEFHTTILNAALKCMKLGIAAPRGHGKTTILSFLYAIFCIAFKKKRHIVILQSTLGKATGSLSTIKYEISNNELLKVFGIEVIKDTQEEAIFKHSDGRTTVVPFHGEDLARGLICKILKEIEE
jgi:predicted RNA binding protein YcfA (HicA-like mRNA interferase family)